MTKTTSSAYSDFLHLSWTLIPNKRWCVEQKYVLSYKFRCDHELGHTFLSWLCQMSSQFEHKLEHNLLTKPFPETQLSNQQEEDSTNWSLEPTLLKP